MLNNKINYIKYGIIFVVFAVIGILWFYNTKYVVEFDDVCLIISEGNTKAFVEEYDDNYTIKIVKNRIITEEYKLVKGKDIGLNSKIKQLNLKDDSIEALFINKSDYEYTLNEIYSVNRHTNKITQILEIDNNQCISLLSDNDVNNCEMIDVGFFLEKDKISSYMILNDYSKNKTFFLKGEYKNEKFIEDWRKEIKRITYSENCSIYGNKAFLNVGDGSFKVVSKKSVESDKFRGYQCSDFMRPIFLFSNAGQYTVYDFSSDKVMSFGDKLSNYLNKKNYISGMIEGMEVNGNELTLLLNDGEKTTLLSVNNNKIEEIKYVYAMSKARMILKIFLMLIGIAIFELFVIKLYKAIKKSGTILWEVTLTIIICIIALDVIVYKATDYYIDYNNNKEYYDVLSEMTKNYINFGFTSNLGKASDKDYVEQIIEVNQNLYYAKNAISILAIEENNYSTKVEFVGYDKNSDTFLNKENVKNVDTLYNKKIVDRIKKAIKDNSIEAFESYSLFSSRALYTISPTYDKNDTINGVYICYIPKKEITKNMNDLSRKVLKYEIIISTVCILVFYLLLLLYLHPYRVFNSKINRVTNGEDVNIKIKNKIFYDETDFVGKKLQEIIMKTKANIDEILKLRKIESKYFDEELVRVLGRDGIQYLDFRENTKQEFYILDIWLPEEFKTQEKINAFLMNIQDTLALGKNMLYVKDEINHIFILSKEEKLVEVSCIINRRYPEAIYFMDKTILNIEILGARDEYRISISAFDRKRREKLLKFSRELDVNYFGSGNAIDEKCPQYVASCIGLVMGEYVYEIEVGDNKGIKRISRAEMKKHVNEFSKGDYVRARDGFVSELIKNPKNKIAIYYIKKIDDLMQEGNEYGADDNK